MANALIVALALLVGTEARHLSGLGSAPCRPRPAATAVPRTSPLGDRVAMVLPPDSVAEVVVGETTPRHTPPPLPTLTVGAGVPQWKAG